MSHAATESSSIYSYPFIALCLIAFFGFGNIAVFYNFYSYLGEIGISPVWRAWLLALQPLAAFVLRPVVSPWLNGSNGANVVCASLVLNGIVLLLYPLATGVAALFAIRALHGVAFVFLVSASLALLVELIPTEKSGAMFGIFTLNTLIPFAAVPPLIGWLLPHVDGMGTIYSWSAVVILPSLLLMLPLRNRHHKGTTISSVAKRPSWIQIRKNLATPGLAIIMAANFFTYMTTTLLFYFMNDYGSAIHLENPGYFFSISLGGTIILRVVGNMIFDKFDQRKLLMGSLLVLAMSCGAFMAAPTPQLFLACAFVYGGSLGFALPLLQSIMFRVSTPAMRGLNANLMLTATDAAYFAGPFAGGVLLSAGVPFTGLFMVAAVQGIVALICILAVRKPEEQPSWPSIRHSTP
ncbi:MFS transporter [Pseudodesulfovibrio sp.]|uniref:MFS transporter n=1 Tax=unclassified Pseudodesulfovibrio TaxID=2661612 RepID=UPI003B008344